MFQTSRSIRVDVIVLTTCLAAAAVIARAQQTPIAAMFGDDQKRDPNFAPSFLVVDLPASKAGGARPKVYLSAGDLERAFDRPEFRPDGAIDRREFFKQDLVRKGIAASLTAHDDPGVQ